MEQREVVERGHACLIVLCFAREPETCLQMLLCLGRPPLVSVQDSEDVVRMCERALVCDALGEMKCKIRKSDKSTPQTSYYTSVRTNEVQSHCS